MRSVARIAGLASRLEHVPKFFPLLPKSALSCNTPSPVGVPEEEIAKAIEVTDGHTLLVMKPVVDTIALSLSGKEALTAMGSNKLQHAQATAATYWDGFYKSAVGCINDDAEPISNAKQKMPGYKIAAVLDLGSDSPTALLNTQPKNPKTAAVRLEFSPARTTKEGFQALLDDWNSIDLDNIPFPALMADARIARLDIAIDVLNVRPPDIFVNNKKVWKIWAASTLEGGVETLNYYSTHKPKGPHVSPHRRANLMVYDKRKEQLASGKLPRFGPLNHTRIEVSLRSNSLLRNLHKQQYPFAAWTFRRADTETPPMPDWLWRLVLDSARLRGFQEAVDLLPKEHHSGADAKNPKLFPADLVTKAIWKHWPEALQQSCLAQLIAWANENPKGLLPID